MTLVTTDKGRAALPNVCAQVCLVLLCLVTARAEAFRNLEVGDPVPQLAVEELSGEAVTPSLTGKVTVLTLWSPNQTGASTLLDQLGQLARTFDAARVEILAIAVGDVPAPEIERLAREPIAHVRVLLDRRGKTRERLGVIALPSTGIVSGDARLHAFQPGLPDDYAERITAGVNALLSAGEAQDVGAPPGGTGRAAADAERSARDLVTSAMALWDGDRAEEAIALLREAIALSPGLKEAHLQLGYILLDQGDAGGALAEFQTVKEQFTRSPPADVGIGIAYLRLGDADAGVRILEQAVALNPDPVRGYAELAGAYHAAGNLREAAFHYRRAIGKLLEGRR